MKPKGFKVPTEFTFEGSMCTHDLCDNKAAVGCDFGNRMLLLCGEHMQDGDGWYLHKVGDIAFIHGSLHVRFAGRWMLELEEFGELLCPEELEDAEVNMRTAEEMIPLVEAMP